MKREHVLKCVTMFLPVLLVFSIVLGIVSDVSAQKKTRTKESSTPKQLTPSEEAGVKLLALQSKGYIDLQIAQPSTFLLIERKVWGAMMHQQFPELRSKRPTPKASVQVLGAWLQTVGFSVTGNC